MGKCVHPLQCLYKKSDPQHRSNQLFFDDDLPDIDPFFFHRHVIFILKPGKNPLDPDSYRGLSLLENLFKIFSKILANRMLRPLSHIQHPQQFGFTRGKGFLEASRCVLDTIQHAKRHNNPLMIHIDSKEQKKTDENPGPRAITMIDLNCIYSLCT